MNHIFLFDVDWTLVWTGGAGVRALDRALLEIFGIPDGMRGVVCDGKTDPSIVREVLSARKLDSPENIEKTLDRYVGHLPATVASAAEYRVLPGVLDTLNLLDERPDVLCGLATGNVEAGARAKLARADLNKYFPTGGFGSDSESRAELVRIGIERARDLLGDARARAVVFGDTPRDVQAAHDAGAVACGVATGNFDESALLAAGADEILKNLTGPEEWVDRVMAKG